MDISDKKVWELQVCKKWYEVWWKKIFFETGKLGLLANGSVTMSDENGNVLLTTVGIKEKWLNEKADFFPLVVDFQEKYYASGKIWGNRFMKRETRPSEIATLTSRMIDRPIRPMFPKGIINDTQIIVSTLSNDNASEQGSWGITSASLALLLAWAPFEWPVSGVKIAKMPDGSYVFDPTFSQEDEAVLHIVVAGTHDAITMVESGSLEVSWEEMLDILKFAHERIQVLCEAQNDFLHSYQEIYTIIPIPPSFNNPDESMYAQVQEFLSDEKLTCLYYTWKKEFQQKLDMLDSEVQEYLLNIWAYTPEDDMTGVWAMVYKRVKECMRKNILEKWLRLDGRACDEVRQIRWETGLLPRTHGSALFQRGMTQVLNVCTLWWPEDNMLVDGMHDELEKRYIHHYNFPPFSVWEVRMLRGAGRREIGHGRLAERALEPVLPKKEDFPYMIRTVSEVLTCNGSSSMASVCGSSLSLMNAGVPLSSPVSWVAMGMIYDEDTQKYVILSDIQAQEDFLGDMDFKLACSKNGITALQLDVKIKWLSMQVFEEIFQKAKASALYILDEMMKIQAEVSPNLPPYAPLIMSLKVPEHQIRSVIGKWGETIQKIQSENNVHISIDDDGLATITAKTQTSWQQAIQAITEILWTPAVGYIGTWKVVKIIEGTWVILEFRWKNSGMIHISKFSKERTLSFEWKVEVGDMLDFEIIQVDLEKWRIGLKRIEK